MTMNRTTFPAALVALGVLSLVLGSGSLAAQDRIEERHSIRADATVEIQVVSHRVEIERWDRDEIEITGSYDAEREELDVRPSPSAFRFQIRVRNGRSWTRRGGAEITVRVPAGVRLDVATVSGGVRARDLAGEVALRSVSGELVLDGGPRAASLETVSGAIRFDGTTPTLRATSVSGGIELGGEAGTVNAQSVSGRIQVEAGGSVERATFNSVSGEVRFRGALRPGGVLRAESHSGGVELILLGSPNARFELSTFSGRLDHSVAGARDERRHSPRWGPGEELSFVTGEGSGRVEVSSFSGSVRIRTEGR